MHPAWGQAAGGDQAAGLETDGQGVEVRVRVSDSGLERPAPGWESCWACWGVECGGAEGWRRVAEPCQETHLVEWDEAASRGCLVPVEEREEPYQAWGSRLYRQG